ncbi:hypothetical protein MKK68_11730 [Methylobacterium sp. E-016]|uniref:hypothetical protein n=1 Tax=Methylobacterium sp. E-016 TaxID=2836556 RepID=UPI001FB96765|nr:hypothetical protein [Methylobacterium sp. E-016]MCJ2076321.1 hypothetical protein [Methylobacterium sp. E-016]
MQQAKDALASTQADLATAKSERDRVISERGQAEQAVLKLTADRDGASSAAEALLKRQADTQAQLATLTETLAGRNKEMAVVEDRLATTRQELAAIQAQLADTRQKLSDQPPPMAVPPVPPQSPAPAVVPKAN